MPGPNAKELGRAAYLLARDGELVGNLTVEGEDKRLLGYHRGCMVIELCGLGDPMRWKLNSRTCVLRYVGSFALEIRWSLPRRSAS